MRLLLLFGFVSIVYSMVDEYDQLWSSSFVKGVKILNSNWAGFNPCMVKPDENQLEEFEQDDELKFEENLNESNDADIKDNDDCGDAEENEAETEKIEIEEKEAIEEFHEGIEEDNEPEADDVFDSTQFERQDFEFKYEFI